LRICAVSDDNVTPASTEELRNEAESQNEGARMLMKNVLLGAAGWYFTMTFVTDAVGGSDKTRLIGLSGVVVLIVAHCYAFYKLFFAAALRHEIAKRGENQ